MGMYTEIYFHAEVSREAADILTAQHDGTIFKRPDHPFFRTERGDWLTKMSSAYFPGETVFTVVPAWQDEYAKYGNDNDERFIVTIRSSIKNYDDEIEKFFDWIKPHVVSWGGGGKRGFIGYSLYEEGEIVPYYLLNEDGE